MFNSPNFEGYGTRIKILESLIWNNRIVSSTKGIEGIDYSKNKNIKVTNQRKKMLKSILLFSNLKKSFTTIVNLFKIFL